MAPTASGPSAPSGVPIYRQTVDDLRKKVMAAANVFRQLDPEVYPRITLRPHGVEEIELYLHNIPTGEPDGWYMFQTCLDRFLGAYKAQDEERKILSRAPTRLGRDLTRVEIPSLSDEERQILLMSNKEFTVRYGDGVAMANPPHRGGAVQNLAPAPQAPPAITQATDDRIRQLEALIASLQGQILAQPKLAEVPLAPIPEFNGDPSHSWDEQVALQEATRGKEDPPSRPSFGPSGGTGAVPPTPSGSGGARKAPPKPTTAM